MTKKPIHWRKWKLTEETRYKSDRAMPYWSQFACHAASQPAQH